MGRGREALVGCSDRSMGTGISIWDVETGDRLMHIPTCASAPHGLLCLKDQFLVASQVNKHGSVGGGAIFTWPLNKPQSPLRSYPLEAIGPIACTTDGVYLAGGSPSGNAYIWEVTSGRLLKTWGAHHSSLKCMVFSNDDSLLISGSDDGIICMWSMISLLDMENSGSSSSLLHYSSEHKSSISGLLTTSGNSNSTFISSSLDATCKAWDLVSGEPIQSQEYPLAITAIILHPVDQFLFAGCIDGRIFVSMLNVGLVDDPLVIAEDPLVVLEGHKGSITALTFSTLGLISASEDCTICLWDAVSWVAIQRFNYHKGAVTNVVVIQHSLLLPSSSHQRVPNRLCVSPLDKCQPPNSSMGTTTLRRTCFSLDDNYNSLNVGTISLERQIFEMEVFLEEHTPAALQMKAETSIVQRMWATRMTKHVMEMNKHLQSRLLDLMQIRLLWNTEDNESNRRKKKKLKIETPLEEEKLLQSQN
ncbi:protein ROOT INITIATION DEFECTIVE 3 isoform X3 [Ricinus communis]|uniref:protein ROOT INITIATION DEFECTIVE 3 isoform X3 n=1 Tax=Ricinus communis TaxID=3988 RepID=UPI00077227C1|nr:protein ROOT INITIATION DEFECTIVE 3 isoform X3 [Ricinus communis]|eukprot:XP_015581803.1 protein ROOT INITIATION DEFECTIVE 3 isoform X1 [Ricinus communis]